MMMFVEENAVYNCKIISKVFLEIDELQCTILIIHYIIKLNQQNYIKSHLHKQSQKSTL